MEYQAEADVDLSATSRGNDGGESFRPLKTPVEDDIVTPKDSKGAHEYLSGPKLWLVAASVTLVMFLTLLDTTIIVTAIPRITTDFQSLPDVGWYGSAYLIATCALQPLTGKIYSQYNLKYTFLAFLGLFEVGSAICGAAQSSTMLIIGRAVAGMGGSGLRNGALNILTESIPLPKRPPYFGVMMGISLCGAIAGPLLGGLFTQYVSWRWCFYVNLPIGGAAAILLLSIKIPNPKKKKAKGSGFVAYISKLDLVGFLFFAPSAVMFLMALEWGGSQYAWNSATIICLFAGAGVVLIIFVSWEYYVGDEAMIPLSMVKRRAVWSSCMTIWFFFGAMMIYSYYLPLYFQAVKGASPLTSGIHLLPLILSQMISSIVSGGLVGKIGYYMPFIIISGILTAISAGLISTFQEDTSTGRWIGYQIIGGFGQGLGMQMPYIAIQNALPEDQNAVALALIVFMQNLGGAIFLAFAQIIFSQSLTSDLAIYAPNVDAKIVEAAGATGFRTVVQPAEVNGVSRAYNSAATKDFYLAVGCAGAILICCWGMGWVNVKKKKEMNVAVQDNDHRLETWKHSDSE